MNESILNHIQAVVWEADYSTNKIVYINDYVVDLLGYPLDMWYKQENFFHQVVYPEDREYVLEKSKNLTRKKDNYTIDFRVIAQDKSVLWVRNCVSIKTAHNKTVKCGYVIDITCLKHHEEMLSIFADQLEDVIKSKTHELYDTKQKYELLNKSTKNCIFRVTENEKIVYVDDKEIAKELGLCNNHSSDRSNSWLDMVYEEDYHRVKNSWNEMLCRGSRMKVEFRTLKHKNQLAWVKVEMEESKQDDHSSYLGYLTNITLEKEILTKLIELKNSEAIWT